VPPAAPAPDGSPIRDSLVLGAAVGVFGLSFGVLAASTGLSVLQACVMSLAVFTGASQFAAIGIVAAGGSVGYAIGSALLLAARNGAYGIAMSPYLPRGRWYRVVAAHITLDESTAMATAQRDAASARVAFWVTGVAVFAFWNIGTLAGALAGTAIADPKTLGLDAAFPAGFVGLLAPHLRGRRGRAAAAFAVVLALALVPLTPPGTPILVSALAIVPAVLFLTPDGRA
jgi:4-azaleucine resistance transporter AzlC